MFHPACLRQAAGQKNSVCAHEAEETEFITSKKDLSQIDLLRILVEELQSKNKILEENNGLLREKIATLEEKLKSEKEEPLAPAPVKGIKYHQDWQATYGDGSGSQHIPISHVEIVELSPQAASSKAGELRKASTTKQSKGRAALPVVEITKNKNQPSSSNERRLPSASLENDISHDDQINKNNKWEKVIYRRKNTKIVNKNSRPEPLRGQNENTASLKPAIRRASLFLSGLAPEVTSDEVQAFLKEQRLTPALNCDKMTTKKGKYYSSFKLTVPYEKIDEYMCTNVWPRGIIINHFRNLQRLYKGIAETPNAGNKI